MRICLPCLLWYSQNDYTVAIFGLKKGTAEKSLGTAALYPALYNTYKHKQSIYKRWTSGYHCYAVVNYYYYVIVMDILSLNPMLNHCSWKMILSRQ